MLEDDAERVRRFTEALRSIDPGLPLLVWRDAKAMVREVGQHLPTARLISLDHDLEPLDGGPDPGDGLEVVKFLVAQPVVCPVIIHTSNGSRGTWMAGEFELAGWRHWRVAPLGDDWVEVDWRRLVKRLLNRAGRGGQGGGRRWWFILRDGDLCEVQLLDRHGKAKAVARFAPGAVAVTVGVRPVPEPVLRLVERLGAGDGWHCDSAGRLLDWMGRPRGLPG
jgi:hypothetical protein